MTGAVTAFMKVCANFYSIIVMDNLFTDSSSFSINGDVILFQVPNLHPVLLNVVMQTSQRLQSSSSQ